MSKPLTVHERLALGQQQRKHMRRAGHAGWNAADRREKPLDLLHAAEKGRLRPLIQLKHYRMSLSPFAFFRGAVPLMAYDLSIAPNSGIFNQLCGDAHVMNLGAFASVNGPIVFDINDFDETTTGPFEWDVKRMATSLILAAGEAGLNDAPGREAALTMLQSYRRNIHKFAAMPLLQSARHQVKFLGKSAATAPVLEAAARSTPLHNLEKLTQPRPPEKFVAGDSPRIFKTLEGVPPAPAKPCTLERLTGALAQSVVDSLATYIDSLLPERQRLFRRYGTLDVAFKVVGTGSVGLRDYCLYLEGNGPKDPLFLQIKEETASAYAPYLGLAAAPPTHQGRRVAEGERAMQFQSDPFLGWTQIDGRDYLVRQLNDHKASIDLATLKPASLLQYAAICGELLARGHARSGDATILAGYLGQSDRFDQALLKFATAYADQAEADWKLLKKSEGSAPRVKGPASKT